VWVVSLGTDIYCCGWLRLYAAKKINDWFWNISDINKFWLKTF
jgi:hypothetical protein